jgi:2-C-methyl-D-erythritol 2,4-cyclodiphosphate synthase
VTRVGLGYDVHRFAPGRALILGGVEIPWAQGLDGHSDADVVIHAIMDALLGAAGLGDIGVHFPPSDDAWRDARSLDLLAIVRNLLPRDWVIENIDATILAEQPKIGPYRAAMSQAIAGALCIGSERVNVKATTNERLGFIGRGEGIAALASAALTPPESAAH